MRGGSQEGGQGEQAAAYQEEEGGHCQDDVERPAGTKQGGG